MNPPILSIVGRSGSGKTTLIENLIPVLKAQRLRVATVKHHFEPDFEIDAPGKDSWRHAQAGSEHVVLASSRKIASIRTLERELTIDEIAADIHNVDIILTEGYKTPDKPKIEVVRAACSQTPISPPEQLLALVTDLRFDLPVPHFALDDIEGIAELILQTIGRPSLAQKPRYNL